MSSSASLDLPPPLSASTSERKVSSSSPAAAAAAARNPISLRLYKVLAANFEDDATREALRTLSEFYQPATDKGKGKQLDAGALHLTNGHAHAEPQTPASALLPAVSTGVAVRARKNLRRDVELRLAECSQQFLRAFGEVDEKLDVLNSHVAQMRAKCDEIHAQLQASNDACKYLLERAEGLQTQRQTLIARSELVNSFLKRFTLTPAETDAMVSRDVPVGQSMFDAIDRTEKIREDCRVLLSGEGGESQAGLDIMATTAQLLEQAFQKLLRWCSFEFRQLGRDAMLEVSPTMREAVRRLRAQPALLTEALSALSSIRQTTLLNSFIDALTRGGPGGMPRPIELHAHDPGRYVGDMLAWVHQAMAGEQEFLESLFGVRHARMVGAVRTAGEGEEESWVRRLMDENLEKLCLPLKVRVQQTTRSQEGSITAYKIANLLQFYLVTMQRTIGEQALLTKTVQEITDFAFKVFFDTLEASGRSLLRFLHPPEADLGPPLTLRDFSHVLREIMEDYARADPEAEGDGFKKILDTSLEPALEMCKRMSELMPPQAAWEQHIFLVNCFVYLQAMLEPYGFTGERVDALEEQIEGHVHGLMDEHYTRLLKDSGLHPVVEALSSQTSGPLSHEPAASSAAVTSALKAFDTFLSTLDVQSSPRLALLSVPSVGSRIHRGALARIARDYGRVCDAVRDARNKYEFASTLLGSQRPFGQMGVLSQVLGIAEDEIAAA
ncbi:oligomeric complex COG6 [Exidia glandulosa HHB12029]|uniref:Conserved oligomeric Golgi complex subunit 6 n=1 Tax=Exidia glandulosa HHB12029 TaxID=1314781 RepID=A0A165PZF7_EXIGL|nr:oligomeric complex COG6 [Exidia glandulosa HHB12029]